MAQKRDGRTQRYEEVIFRNYSHVWIVTSERKRLEKHPVTQKELALGLAILQRQCSKWFVIERFKNRGVPGHPGPMAPDPNAILRYSQPPLNPATPWQVWPAPPSGSWDASSACPSVAAPPWPWTRHPEGAANARPASGAVGTSSGRKPGSTKVNAGKNGETQGKMI